MNRVIVLQLLLRARSLTGKLDNHSPDGASFNLNLDPVSSDSNAVESTSRILMPIDNSLAQ